MLSEEAEEERPGDTHSGKTATVKSIPLGQGQTRVSHRAGKATVWQGKLETERYLLVGVVEASATRALNLGSNPSFGVDEFLGQTSAVKIGNPVATLPGARHYGSAVELDGPASLNRDRMR